MDTIQTLVRSIFQKDSLHDCSVEELQSLARQYPYFTPVQFLLAEKLKLADENLYKEQLQKLSLHFSNPLWLDYLLNGYKQQESVEPVIENDTVDGVAPIVEEPTEIKVEESFIKSEAEIAEPIQEELRESFEENRATVEETTTEGEPESSETKAEEQFHEPEASVVESVREEISEPAPETSDAYEEPATDLEQHEPIDTFKEETFEESKAEPYREQEEISETAIPLPPLPDLKEEPAVTQLTFQPYHTVDYFASQGVKFVAEEKPADRFGKQLKSFTEWLKTMKRLPQSEITKITDASSEEKVQQLADHSITEGEVVTETMAEVWLKQGNKEKAIETYNKLSLLNPDKSAYFASLVEQLKNS